MTRTKKIACLAKEHASLHPGLLQIVGRCISYSLIQFLSMWVSARWLHDTYAANSSLFLVLVFVFELGRTALHKQADARNLIASSCIQHTNSRLLWYVIALIGIALCGILLVQEATCLNKAVGQQRSK